MEDDFVSCEDNIIEIIQSIDVLEEKKKGLIFIKNNSKGWCNLIVSYGMNGMIFPKKDSLNFAKYSRKNIKISPIDILAQNFLFGNNIENGCFSNNRIVYTYKFVF
jgi:hypothetical protein